MVSSGRTPWWRRRQREHFARAVDALPDPNPPHDPRLAGEVAVVHMLRRAAEATSAGGPDNEARERMRAKVFAELTRPEPRPSPVPRPRVPAAPAGAKRSRPAGSRGWRSGTRGRLAIALGAAFCVVLALSGMTLLLSRNALPGDPLYGVRRTVEGAALGFTSGADARGQKHLQYAADRVGDIESLAGRYGRTDTAPVGDYLTAFADFDADARAGSADLTGFAVGHGPAQLHSLHDWADQQRQRIERVTPSLPPPAAQRAGHSVDLLARIEQRATALLGRDACFSITSGGTDDLGVLPAGGPCDRPPAGAPAHPNGTVFGPGTARTSSAEPTAHGRTNGLINPYPATGAPVPTRPTAPTPVPASPAAAPRFDPPVFPAPILAPPPGPPSPLPTAVPSGTLHLPPALTTFAISLLSPGLPAVSPDG